MPDRQRLSRTARGAALLLAWAFLAMSLAGYDPADPPGSATDPPGATTSNPCGPVGAWIAHVLMQAIGWASGLVLLAVAVVAFLRFVGRSILEPWPRLLGLGLVVAVAAAGIARLAPGSRHCPPVGPGGYLGALLVALLGGQFGPIGM